MEIFFEISEKLCNHPIKVLLILTGRSEHSCSQLNMCVTVMMMIPPGEFMNQVHIADHQSEKAPAPKGDIIPIEATIMSLTLHYQSIDCLQAN